LKNIFRTALTKLKANYKQTAVKARGSESSFTPVDREISFVSFAFKNFYFRISTSDYETDALSTALTRHLRVLSNN